MPQIRSVRIRSAGANQCPCMRRDAWTHLGLIPSVYGFVLFVATFILYQLQLIAYEPMNGETLTLCLFAVTVYLFSAMLHVNSYSSAGQLLAARMAIPGPHDPVLTDHIALGVMHLIGFLGLTLYVRTLIDFFGSPLLFFLALKESTHEVRWAAASIQTIGIQLTYVGWIAIALTACTMARGSVRVVWIIAALAQFAGNLVFVDRTRPMWILVTCGLVVMASRFHRLRTAQLLRRSILASVGLVMLFVVVGFWVGKVSTEDPRLFGTTRLPPVAQPVYYYITSSFAYLNRITDVEDTFSWSPERSLYPLFQALASLGLTDPPPSQVNDVYFVPVPANTGTILEPLYRDGGAVYATIGFAALVFIMDSLALAFVRNGSFIALLAWAHLCFCNLLAFFTPKFNNTPLWMVVFIAIATLLFSASRGARLPIFGHIRRA